MALITGASRGLGFLLARGFAAEGCPLVICARDGAELGRARSALEEAGATVLALECDVTDRAAVERLLDAATRHYGRVDILVNNAGTIIAGPARNMTLADFELAMAVMYWGVVYTTLAVLPQMVERGQGRIVNITSIGGRVAVPHLLPYASAKFAAVGFSEGLRAELARDGIAVTTIAPGLMRSGSFLNAFFKGRQEQEFAPFAVLASLPFFSMDAGRAARQIIQATKRRDAERVLSLSAAILARFHGLFPGATADILGLVNRILPGPTPERDAISRGMDIHERVRSRLFDTLVGWNLDAARRLHQYPGPLSTLPPEPASLQPPERRDGGLPPRVDSGRPTLRS